ncbi:hypothetical protein KXX40_009319, partial [Aspergillus fumigatus]
MRDPRFFTRALIISQIGSTLIYLVIGVVVYYYCGSHVASPALGSAGPIIKKISYGIALPGLLATTTIVIHVSPLVLIYTTPYYPLVRMAGLYLWIYSDCLSHCKRYSLLQQPRFAHWSLPGVILAYQPTGCMWFYDNWRKRDTGNWKWILMACWNVFVILIGSFMTVAGTYGAIVNI